MSQKIVYVEPDAIAKECAATTLSNMKRRALREELAKILFERHYKNAGVQAYMIAKWRENWSLFLPEVEREFMPLIDAALAGAAAEEREACAELLERQHNWITNVAASALIRRRS